MKRKNNQIIGGSAFLRMGKKRIGTGIDLSNLKSTRIISLDAFSEDVINCGCASNFSRVLKLNNSRTVIPEVDTKLSYQISIDGFERWTFW